MDENIKKSQVHISDGKVFRDVIKIEDSKKIIDVVAEKGIMGSDVVTTEIFSESDKVLEHKFIKNIIHSGEYTESMAYDVTEKCIDMAVDFVKSGVYSYDLLPHNFTYCNGNWLLYDFGALELTPYKVRTQIRGVFKISFAAFELLKIINRQDMKHYFLNRIKIEELFKMIPVYSYFIFVAKLFICKTLYTHKQYELSYKMLKYFFNQYKRKHNPEDYSYKITDDLKNIYKIIDNILEKHYIKDVFCAGETSANWALSSSSDKNINKFLYIDDYNLCDKIYNYIYKKRMNNLSTAVIYPFKDDDIIPENYKYRGLYDSFAQKRFTSDAVVILNYKEVFENKDIKSFLSAISNFTNKLLLLKINKNDALFGYIKTGLSEIFENITTIENNDNIIILAKDKITPNTIKSDNYVYENANRIAFAKLHSDKIIEILKNR